MRVVIDLQAVQGLSRFRGIGRYSLSLAQAMVRSRGDHEVIIALNGMLGDSLEQIRAAFDGLLPMENIRVWQGVAPTIPLDPSNAWRHEAAQLTRETFLASLQPDVVHVTSLFEGLADNAVHSIGLTATKFPTAVTFYDLIPLLEREKYLTPNPDIERFYLEALSYLRHADLFLAISESSKEELIEHLQIDPDRAVNISAAADAHFKPVKLTKSQINKLRDTFGLQKPFVMYSGATDERKNHRRLIEAYAELPSDIRLSHQLAIVGKVSEFDRNTLYNVIDDSGVGRDEVIITGQVSDDELIGLYNLCKLFVFPSWHEGFGLPALEAMSCGAPVIASNTTSLPEVVGRADALFDPFSVKDISRKIAEALSDPSFLESLARHGLGRAKAFSWEESARRTWEAFEQFNLDRLAKFTLALPTRRKRLAFVSPMPPERSGIADYSAEILPELSIYYDVHVITDQPVVSAANGSGCGIVKTVEWFWENLDEFDRVVYQFGNSTFHQHMFDLLEKKPGVVVLHDFFLSGVLAHIDATGRWTRELYWSHGYSAVREMVCSDDWTKQIIKYPCNASVWRQSVGMIVHSQFSRQMANEWYGPATSREWAVVPLVRAPDLYETRAEARKALNIQAGTFLICSFGLLDPTKQNHRLLEAWLASPLAKEKNCHLVFVGQNHGGDYGNDLLDTIDKSGLGKRITITGWANPATFRRYLAAADMAVQLRAMSRGETSAAVLDCMKYGIATIVNANGSMAELPRDAVYMLPDDYTDKQLERAITELWSNEGNRSSLGGHARRSILARNAPRACARQYVENIEYFYAQQDNDNRLFAAIDDIDGPSPVESDLVQLSEALAQNRPPPGVKQLLVDISALVATDLKTGVERVVRKILSELIAAPPSGYRVEPVYARPGEEGYRYARQFTFEFIGAHDRTLSDDPVEAFNGDIFLGLDLQQNIVADQSAYYQRLRANGIRVYFVVYDLLPVLMPQAFPEWSEGMHARWLHTIQASDGAICISRAVADEMATWMGVFGMPRVRPFQIGWFHLGADFGGEVAGQAAAKRPMPVVEKLGKRPTFLMVGTVEPRKGHMQVLKGFDLLWKKGIDANLIIVGGEGWKGMPDDQRRSIPEVVLRLKKHPEMNRRLFWISNVDDDELQQIYTRANGLIAASLGEGFGLPIVEAAQFGLPVIARDIPVFREVAGKGAVYFSGEGADTFADCVKSWLDAGNTKREAKVQWTTWKESTVNLLSIALDGQWYKQILPEKGMRYWPGDGRLQSESGVRRENSYQSVGKAGYLTFGPSINLEPGNYTIVFHGKLPNPGSGHIVVDVVAEKATIMLAKHELKRAESGERLISVSLSLKKLQKEVEFRVWVDESVLMEVSMIEVRTQK